MQENKIFFSEHIVYGMAIGVATFCTTTCVDDVFLPS